MPPKSDTFTFNQVKEVMEKHEETILKFFNATVDRLEKKISNLTEENILIKKEMKDLKESLEFQGDLFEKKLVENDKKKENNLEKEKEMEEKMAEMEDRCRRNNLRFDGIEENGNETWEESEEKLKAFLKTKLGIENNVTIERAHRTGKLDGEKPRTIIAKFLSYKTKTKVLKEFKEKKLWEEHLYINEDFSTKTREKRKELFKKAKELRNLGKYAHVVYNKLIVKDFRSNYRD